MAFNFTSTAPTATHPTSSAFGFGKPAAPMGSSFGGGFGQTPAAGASFGGGFGPAAPIASAAPFGTASTLPFGSTAGTAFGGVSTAQSGFGGMGTGQGAFGGMSTGQGAFGGGLGGAAKPGGLTFGAPASAPATGFGFNQAPAMGGASAFNQTPAMGGASAFGSSFGAPAPMGFGTNPLGGGFMSQPAARPGGMFAPPAPAAPADPTTLLYNAVLQCTVFGDERDSVLARWNMLQASWGTGQAFYSSSAAPLVLNADNPLCRFKTIGYSAMPKAQKEDGVMSALVKKKVSELEGQRGDIPGLLHGVLGSRPNLRVVLEGLGSAGAEASEITFHVLETNQQTGQTRKVPVDEIYPFLSAPAQSTNLQRMGIESLSPKVSFTEAEIKEYLDHPPHGLDPRLWKQAHLENPNSSELIPVPMMGFKTLQQRILRQDHQAKTYQGRLDAIATDIVDLQKRHQDALAKMKEVKRRQLGLGHRILHVIVKQEECRKVGFTIQPEEERLRIQFEALQSEISAPTQFKGRLNELLSQVRLRTQSAQTGFHGASSGGKSGTVLDPFLQQDVKQILKQQQDAIQALVALITDDIKDLAVVTDAMDEENLGKSRK